MDASRPFAEEVARGGSPVGGYEAVAACVGGGIEVAARWGHAGVVAFEPEPCGRVDVDARRGRQGCVVVGRDAGSVDPPLWLDECHGGQRGWIARRTPRRRVVNTGVPALLEGDIEPRVGDEGLRSARPGLLEEAHGGEPDVTSRPKRTVEAARTGSRHRGPGRTRKVASDERLVASGVERVDIVVIVRDLAVQKEFMVPVDDPTGVEPLDQNVLKEGLRPGADPVHIGGGRADDKRPRTRPAHCQVGQRRGIGPSRSTGHIHVQCVLPAPRVNGHVEIGRAAIQAVHDHTFGKCGLAERN